MVAAAPSQAFLGAAPSVVAKAPRRPIARTRVVTLGELPAAERAALVEQLYAVYLANSNTLDRAGFERVVLPSDEMRVALFLGRDGELAGFSAARIQRIVVNGREQAVFGAGVHILPAYRGGSASAVFGLTEALRFKLKNPRIPLSYVTTASNPAVYKLFARTLRRYFPRRDQETPAEVEAIVQAISQKRGVQWTGEDPWLARTFVRPSRPERIRGSRALQNDPDVAFYVARNPGFAEGDGSALLVFVPLDAADIAHGLLRAGHEQASALLRKAAA
ncbi:hypothetical protein A7982_13415 [Minicystis rosea]|nr:hypothetical protein A7982_13415 [Minicystis rosea]